MGFLVANKVIIMAVSSAPGAYDAQFRIPDTPLGGSVRKWRALHQIGASQQALSVLSHPEVVAVCGDQAHQAILAGFYVSNDHWRSGTRKLLEYGMESSDNTICTHARDVMRQAEKTLLDAYGDELLQKIDDFSQTHLAAYQADGNGAFWKRQKWFVIDRFGKAFDVLETYGLADVKLLP